MSDRRRPGLFGRPGNLLLDEAGPASLPVPSLLEGEAELRDAFSLPVGHRIPEPGPLEPAGHADAFSGLDAGASVAAPVEVFELPREPVGRFPSARGAPVRERPAPHPIGRRSPVPAPLLEDAASVGLLGYSIVDGPEASRPSSEPLGQVDLASFGFFDEPDGVGSHPADPPAAESPRPPDPPSAARQPLPARPPSPAAPAPVTPAPVMPAPVMPVWVGRAVVAVLLTVALIAAWVGGRSVSPGATVATGAAPAPLEAAPAPVAAAVALPAPPDLATGEGQGAALPVPDVARDIIKLPAGQGAGGQLGYLQVSCDRAGVVYVDDVRKSTTDDPRLIELTAGRHRVRVVAGGRSRSQDVRVDAGRSNSALVRFNQ